MLHWWMNEVINMQGMECPPPATLGRNSRGSFAGGECVCVCVEVGPEKEGEHSKEALETQRMLLL